MHGHGLGTLGSCTPDALLWLLHVAFSGCRTRIVVFNHQLFIQVWAPFEEILAKGFEEGGYFRVAQGLMGKLYHVCLHSNRMGERGYIVQRWLFLVHETFSQQGTGKGARQEGVG